MNCGLRNSEENHSNAWSIELLLDAKRKFASQGFCLSYPLLMEIPFSPQLSAVWKSKIVATMECS